jgi:surface protein
MGLNRFGNLQPRPKNMNSVTMKLMERNTGLPLDLVVLINTFVYEKLTDRNFFDAVALWFDNNEECKWRFGPISCWNTSRITNMDYTFYNRKTFNEDISRWNVSKVRQMCFMFYKSTCFNGDISLWDVRQVTSMRGMFLEASRFNGDIGLWDVSNVQDMSSMFYGASQFNGDIGLWDVSNVQDMNSMFEEASQFSADLSQWDVSHVLDMGYMFHGANQSKADLSRWQLNETAVVRQMFDSENKRKRGFLHWCYLFKVRGSRNLFHPSIDDVRALRREWGCGLILCLTLGFLFLCLFLVFFNLFHTGHQSEE